MTSKVETIYNLLRKSILERLPAGKICIPISTGLDSRVVAGIVREIREIDLMYHQFYGESTKDLRYIKQISELCNSRLTITKIYKSDIIDDKDKISKLTYPEIIMESGNYTGLRLTQTLTPYNLKNYTFLVPYGLDALTGIGVNPLTLFNYRDYDKYYMEKKHYVNETFLQDTWRHFGKGAINPIWDNQLIKFCLALPVRYRFHQYLYRKMIKKYFPDLAAIPREGMNCKIDCNELTYFYKRTIYYFRKKVEF